MAKAVKGSKSTAWDSFAQWVRVRDCIETTQAPFTGFCITCKKKFHISYLDAGHLFAGKGNAKLFHEDTVKAQCRMCNQFRNGRAAKFRKVMEERHGAEQIETWQAEVNKVIHDKDMDYPAITQKYRAKLHDLLVPFGYNNYEELKRGSSW